MDFHSRKYLASGGDSRSELGSCLLSYRARRGTCRGAARPVWFWLDTTAKIPGNDLTTNPDGVSPVGYPLFHVDAFTNRPFGGNPAAVCLLPAWREDRWLQAVAREMNLSETA